MRNGKLANSTNSKVVYTLNDDGQEIAVSLFVTESFHKKDHDDYDCQDVNVDENDVKSLSPGIDNSSWVAAEEICVTDYTNNVNEEEIKPEMDRSKLVKVYKFNKGKGHSQQQKKLNEMKRRPSLTPKVKLLNKSGTRHRLAKMEKVKVHREMRKKSKKRKVKTDLTFPMPQTVRKVKLPSNSFFFHIIFQRSKFIVIANSEFYFS